MLEPPNIGERCSRTTKCNIGTTDTSKARSSICVHVGPLTRVLACKFLAFCHWLVARGLPCCNCVSSSSLKKKLENSGESEKKLKRKKLFYIRMCICLSLRIACTFNDATIPFNSFMNSECSPSLTAHCLNILLVKWNVFFL